MIFVTVGTHEQPFDRVLRKIDELVQNRIIDREIFAQIGYTSYRPRGFRYKKVLTFREMNNFAKEARIFITHGGPGSVILALRYGKVPIVVPRQKKYGEHVDNHQVLFSKRLEAKKKIIAVYEMKYLGDKISSYDAIVQKLGIPRDYHEVVHSKVEIFAKKLDKICQELCEDAL